MKSGVQITGISDVNEVLREIGPKAGKSLMSTVVFDIAKKLSKSASDYAPQDQGQLKKGIFAKRERGNRTTLESTANVDKKVFYWRFLEYGQGPDNFEHAFFLKALQAMRPEMDRTYLEVFGQKLEQRMARQARAAARAAR